MTASIQEYIGALGIEGDLYKYITVFIVAMLPIVELRGAVPIGVVALGLPVAPVFIVSVLGNMLPVPFIILFIRRVFEWLSGKSDRLRRFIRNVEARAEKKGVILYKYEVLGLMLLVAVPLPGTGAWTGALIASIFDIRLKVAVPAILAGVVVAGLIMTALSGGLGALIA